MKIKLKIKKVIFNIKNKLNNLKGKSNKTSDMLILLAFFIIAINTLNISVHIGLYIVAIELIILSYFISN